MDKCSPAFLRRIVYERLKSKLIDHIKLLVHPRLPIAGRVFEADLGLKSEIGFLLRIEAVGSVGRDFRALNAFSERCIVKLITKFNACEETGVPLPFVIYADEICDLKCLDAAIDIALMQFNGAAK